MCESPLLGRMGPSGLARGDDGQLPGEVDAVKRINKVWVLDEAYHHGTSNLVALATLLTGPSC
jgi:hypothetical protein